MFLEQQKPQTGNALGEEGASVLSEALKVNTTLTALDLTSVQPTTGQRQTSDRCQPRRSNRKQDPLCWSARTGRGI